VPVLTWTQHGKFAKIAAPEWWEQVLELLFPPDGNGPPSIASYGEGDGQSIEIWAVPSPGRGYVLAIADGICNQLLWVQNGADYLDLMTSRGAVWLMLPAAT
jgi:hypothetical protein